MGMGLAGYAWLLVRLLEKPRKCARRTVHRTSDRPLARYGGCPACGEFLYIAPSTVSSDVRCPTCGRLFDRRTPLRPVISEERPTDALYDREVDG